MTKCVRVTWMDAASPEGYGWNNEKKIKKDLGLLEIQTLGWLVHQTKQFITVGQNRDAGGCYSNFINIPSSTIKKIKRL